MITASHNPKEYDGIKVVKAGATMVGGERGIERTPDVDGLCDHGSRGDDQD